MNEQTLKPVVVSSDDKLYRSLYVDFDGKSTDHFYGGPKNMGMTEAQLQSVMSLANVCFIVYPDGRIETVTETGPQVRERIRNIMKGLTLS